MIGPVVNPMGARHEPKLAYLGAAVVVLARARADFRSAPAVAIGGGIRFGTIGPDDR
jgi:hypothetical protein